MIWDWTAKKNLQLSAEEKTADEQLDEGKSPVYPPEYGYRKSPRLEPKRNANIAVNAEKESEKTVEKENSNRGNFVNLPAEKKDLSEKQPEFEDVNDVWEASDILASLKESFGEKRPDEGRKFKELKSGFSVSGQKFSSATVVNVDDDSGIWEWQFSLFNLPGMDLVEAEYTPLDTNKRLELRRMFRRIRRDFLRYIAYYNQPELEEAGVEDKGIRSLKKGKAPENYDVHLKIPYEYGGKNEFANMLFIQTHPFGEDIHKFLDMQTTSQPFGCRLSKLYIPVAEGRVYIPKDSSTIGGGKGMGDKTSVQGYSAAALQQMAVKSTMDRGAGI